MIAMMFKEGDRVHHLSRDDNGTVLKFERPGEVRVKFDRASRPGRPDIGIFDEVWFKTHPGWLTPVGAPREGK
jgi:hypothetical protein